MSLIYWIIKGLTLGFGISLLLGPIFFMMVETGITNGFRKGLFFAMGTWLSDLGFILITPIFIKELKGLIDDDFIFSKLRILFGLIFIGIAIAILFKSRKSFNNPELNSNTYTKNLFKSGFFINSFNPNALIIWIGASTLLFSQENNPSMLMIIAYFASIQVVIMGTDLLKIYIGSKLKHHVPAAFLPRIQWFSAILLALFGLYLIFW